MNLHDIDVYARAVPLGGVIYIYIYMYLMIMFLYIIRVRVHSSHAMGGVSQYGHALL